MLLVWENIYIIFNTLQARAWSNRCLVRYIQYVNVIYDTELRDMYLSRLLLISK